jgi:beta-D-xylosidase 4
VTNTGKMDADDAVLGFLKPPGAGANGVPLQTLFAFERVHIPAGATVTVELYPSLAEFTQVDSEGVRAVAPGEYTFSFGVEATEEHGQGFTTHTITAN